MIGQSRPYTDIRLDKRTVVQVLRDVRQEDSWFKDLRTMF